MIKQYEFMTSLIDVYNLHSCATATMADDEDDYLSDKFLVETSAPVRPQTYAEKRKEAQKLAQIKNEENRLKSRRQRELESREEGLSKSLFERAKEEEASGVSAGNKALSMMMKMGFKPGQALGKLDDAGSLPVASSEPEAGKFDKLSEPTTSSSQTEDSHNALKHKIEPIPINEWMGMLILQSPSWRVAHETLLLRQKRYWPWKAASCAIAYIGRKSCENGENGGGD